MNRFVNLLCVFLFCVSCDTPKGGVYDVQLEKTYWYYGNGCRDTDKMDVLYFGRDSLFFYEKRPDGYYKCINTGDYFLKPTWHIINDSLIDVGGHIYRVVSNNNYYDLLGGLGYCNDKLMKVTAQDLEKIKKAKPYMVKKRQSYFWERHEVDARDLGVEDENEVK